MDIVCVCVKLKTEIMTMMIFYFLFFLDLDVRDGVVLLVFWSLERAPRVSFSPA